MLFPTQRQIAHALLTRPPLDVGEQAPLVPFDLHVLGTPPAFVLSQDQTLCHKILNCPKAILIPYFQSYELASILKFVARLQLKSANEARYWLVNPRQV